MTEKTKEVGSGGKILSVKNLKTKLLRFDTLNRLLELAAIRLIVAEKDRDIEKVKESRGRIFELKQEMKKILRPGSIVLRDILDEARGSSSNPNKKDPRQDSDSEYPPVVSSPPVSG